MSNPFIGKERGKIPLLFKKIRDVIYSFSQVMKAKYYPWMSSLKVTRKINMYFYNSVHCNQDLF